MRRRQINNLLQGIFHRSKPSDNVHYKDCCQRQCGFAPGSYNYEVEGESERQLWFVKDEKWWDPSFGQILYQNLDFDLVPLYVLWFFFVERWTGNAPLAIFVVYLLERGLRIIRKVLGKRNLQAKSMIPANFMM